MAGTSSWLIRGLRWCGIAAAIATCAAAARIAAAADGGASESPKPAAAAEEQFISPENIAKRFSTELARLATGREIVSPATLARQAEANKSCFVSTLADPGKKLDPETIYTRARPGVVILAGLAKGRKRGAASLPCATGFVIHKDGVIVTNFHVVEAFEDMKTFGVMTDDGRVFPIKAVLAGDRQNDIAVLRVEADNLTPLPVAGDVRVGAPVYCLSHPALDSEEKEYGFFAFTQGMVSGKFRLPLHGNPPLNVLAITADYAKGSSGGPILNEHGAVVGIVCETSAITYDESSQELQMTWKFSRPSGSILALLRDAKPAQK